MEEEQFIIDELDSVEYATKIIRKARTLDLQGEVFVEALQAMENDRNLTINQALQRAEQSLQ